MTTASRFRRRRVLAPLAIAAILFGAHGCKRGDDAAAGEADAASENLPVVEVVTLQQTDFIERLTLTGETEPIRAAVIASEAGGRIVTFNVVEGRTVEKGETLVKVDTSQQGAQAAQLRAQLAQLDSDIARAERLAERGLAKAAEIEQLRSQREATRQQLRGVYIGVGNGTTEAPFAGTIVQQNAELGEFASPGASLGRLIDVSQIKVLVDLPERAIRVVTEGQTATVEIPSLDQRFEGTVTRVSREADTRNRTFPVEVQIDNPDGELRAGMRARVLLDKSHLEDVVVAPIDSLMQGLAGAEAVIVKDGTTRVVTVSVGPTRGSYAVITDGLNPGDPLIVRGQADVVDNERVDPVVIGECCVEQLKSYGVTTDAAQANAAPPANAAPGSTASDNRTE